MVFHAKTSFLHPYCKSNALNFISTDRLRICTQRTAERLNVQTQIGLEPYYVSSLKNVIRSRVPRNLIIMVCSSPIRALTARAESVFFPSFRVLVGHALIHDSVIRTNTGQKAFLWPQESEDKQFESI